MYHLASSMQIASRKCISSRSFATAKKVESKSIYRRLVGPTILCAAGCGLYYFYKNPFDKESYYYTLDNPTAYELESLTPKQVAAHTLVMNRTFSRLVGKMMNITLPVSWRKPTYSKVSKWLGVNTEEFEGTYEDYPTPNSFFTRDLKKEVRPIIRCEDLLLSPVDGTVSILEEHLPTTQNIQLHQVKGVRYDLTEFMGKSLHLQDPSNHLYSAVIYLSPSNYHHIHTPVDFSIEERVHVPGQLLPVKSYYASKVKGLFTLNERVVLNGKWKEGFFSLGMVGAFNVGSIRITNPNDVITTNQPHELIYKNYKHRRVYDQNWVISQGTRCGTFELGSTVVLAFEAPQFTWLVEPGEKVKMGQPIGYVNYTEDVEKITEVLYPEALEASRRQVEKVAKEAGLIEDEKKEEEEREEMIEEAMMKVVTIAQGVVADEIVADEIVEDEIVEDEIVEDEVAEDEVVEDEIVDDMVEINTDAIPSDSPSFNNTLSEIMVSPALQAVVNEVMQNDEEEKEWTFGSEEKQETDDDLW